MHWLISVEWTTWSNAGMWCKTRDEEAPSKISHPVDPGDGVVEAKDEEERPAVHEAGRQHIPHLRTRSGPRFRMRL